MGAIMAFPRKPEPVPRLVTDPGALAFLRACETCPSAVLGVLAVILQPRGLPPEIAASLRRQQRRLLERSPQKTRAVVRLPPPKG